jgi:hypothetical protein
VFSTEIQQPPPEFLCYPEIQQTPPELLCYPEIQQTPPELLRILSNFVPAISFRRRQYNLICSVACRMIVG